MHRRKNLMLAMSGLLNKEGRYVTNNSILKIYTDASYNNQKQIGSVAYIITQNDVELMRDAFVLKEKSDSFFLECMAISVAVRECAQKYPSTNIEVYTDNYQALAFYQKRLFTKERHWTNKFLRRICYTDIFMLPVTYHYVKGHQNIIKTNDKNAYFNNIVDKMANSTMKQCVRYSVGKNLINS
jgi:ribonuclease HI